MDEFQDTDPLQAEILLLLSAADPEATDWRTVVPVPGRLFIVGDPKQSIYRFRRADVAIYREVCARLESAGARRVKLTTSFRSVPGIQAVVNAAFEPVMTGDDATLQADYVRLTQHRRPITGQPAVVALPVPEPYGTRNVSAIRIEQSLPDGTGAFIDWLVTDSGWKVDGGRPIEARDVCILFRRFLSFGEDVTLPYVRALEARGVRHVLVGGKTFHDREEVETIRAALAAVEWPDDELSVFAALRGALFAIGDEELLEWKQRFSGFHPFRIPSLDGGPAPLDHLQPIAVALAVLQRMHRRRNYRPVAETVQDLLDATRAHVAIVLRSARRAGAGERAAHRAAGARLRIGRRAVVPRLRGRADQRGRERAVRGGADPRRGQRRRPPHDRAQGERPRVPGRGPRRRDVQAVARGCVALARSRHQPLRAEARRVGADRSAAARRRGSGA